MRVWEYENESMSMRMSRGNEARGARVTRQECEGNTVLGGMRGEVKDIDRKDEKIRDTKIGWDGVKKEIGDKKWKLFYMSTWHKNSLFGIKTTFNVFYFLPQ